MPVWCSHRGAHMVQEHMQRVFVVFRSVQNALECLRNGTFDVSVSWLAAVFLVCGCVPIAALSSIREDSVCLVCRHYLLIITAEWSFPVNSDLRQKWWKTLAHLMFLYHDWLPSSWSLLKVSISIEKYKSQLSGNDLLNWDGIIASHDQYQGHLCLLFCLGVFEFFIFLCSCHYLREVWGLFCKRVLFSLWLWIASGNDPSVVADNVIVWTFLYLCLRAFVPFNLSVLNAARTL